MVLISGTTSGTSISYTSPTVGGIGLLADLPSPSLLGSIVGITGTIIYEEPLYSYISALNPDNTNSFITSGSVIYTGQIPGGAGLIGVLPRPDLQAAYTIDPNKFRPGFSNLTAIIRAKREATEDLKGYIRAALSGNLDLSADIYGYAYRDLTSFIRPQFSGSANLNSFIEPIPPKDLLAELYGYSSVELSGSIEPIPPVELPASISGQLSLALQGNIHGYDYSDITSTYSGFFDKTLGTLIKGVVSGFSTLNAQIRGFLEIEANRDLNAYIRTVSGSNEDLDSYIKGVSYKDLIASIRSLNDTTTDLQAVMSGSSNDTLQGIITPTGYVSDLNSYIRGAVRLQQNLQALIDGHGRLDLQAIIDAELAGNLYASITTSGTNNGLIFGNITGVEQVNLSAQYSAAQEGIIGGNIEPIPANSLYAVIQPKVFFIDTTIPINTYPFNNLKAVINAHDCDFDSLYQDLHVSIYGTSAEGLQANLISVAGQYAMATDELTLLTKSQVVSEDWVFFVLKQPILSEDAIKIILTNSPLSDLSASIVGIQSSQDLNASISTSFFATVKRDGIPIGQWVNIKTGERRLIKVFFQGNASDFYYSTEGNKTFSKNVVDSLSIVVEVYTKEDDSNSLLARKTEVKRCVINNLADFDSIDEAIKYGIMCAASEIYSGLRAEIFGVGEVKPLNATISPIDTRTIKNLNAGITPVSSAPDLEAIVSGTGSTLDLSSYIHSILPASTSNSFNDTLGNRYVPKLVLYGDNQYSVVLTKVLSTDMINLSGNPDLSANITGISVSDLSATISG